jgi:AAA15 family ATPase/GTPase
MLPIWKAMLTAAEAFHVQLFISTHNTEILEKLRLTLEETELSHLRNQISHYTFVRKEDRSVEAIRYSYDQFENAIARNIEIR